MEKSKLDIVLNRLPMRYSLDTCWCMFMMQRSCVQNKPLMEYLKRINDESYMFMIPQTFMM